MNRINKAIALTLILIIFMSISAVDANADNMKILTTHDIESKEVATRITYNTITDTDQLLTLATQQYYSDVRNIGVSAANEKSIVATQLVGITTYTDGSIQKDYVATAFLLMDNGQPLSRASLATQSRLSDSSHWGYRDTNVVHTCYYSTMIESGTRYYRITSVSTVANDTGTDAVYVSKFVHEIYTKDQNTTRPYVTSTAVTNPVPGHSYTLTNPYAIYIADVDNADAYSAAGPITYSDGYKWNYYLNIVIV